jgi:hypothetical protein
MHNFQVFQSHSRQLLSDVILDEIKKLCALYESRNPSFVVRELTISEGGSDDIEVEDNAYFQHKVLYADKCLFHDTNALDKRGANLSYNWNYFGLIFCCFF